MRLLVGSLVGLALATTGCFVDTKPGDSGPASFGYQLDDSWSSPPLDHPALAGSKVKVNAFTGADKDVASVRVSPPSGFVHLDSAARSCDSLTCTFTMNIETSQPGDGAIELVDSAGNVVDRAPFAVRAAARVDLVVEDDTSFVPVVPKGDHLFEIAKGKLVALVTHVFDANDEELFFTGADLTVDFADPSVVAPSPGLFASYVEVKEMVGQGVGETTVSARVSGASATANFRVVP